LSSIVQDVIQTVLDLVAYVCWLGVEGAQSHQVDSSLRQQVQATLDLQQEVVLHLLEDLFG